MRFVRQPTKEEIAVKYKNLDIALCEFGEYAKWFNDNVEEIPVVGAMERPITEWYTYDENGYVVTYPNSDSVIGFDVLECAKLLDKMEAEHYQDYELNDWYEYLHASYASLWRHLDFD